VCAGLPGKATRRSKRPLCCQGSVQAQEAACPGRAGGGSPCVVPTCHAACPPARTGDCIWEHCSTAAKVPNMVSDHVGSGSAAPLWRPLAALARLNSQAWAVSMQQAGSSGAGGWVHAPWPVSQGCCVRCPRLLTCQAWSQRMRPAGLPCRLRCWGAAGRGAGRCRARPGGAGVSNPGSHRGVLGDAARRTPERSRCSAALTG